MEFLNKRPLLKSQTLNNSKPTLASTKSITGINPLLVYQFAKIKK